MWQSMHCSTLLDQAQGQQRMRHVSGEANPTALPAIVYQFNRLACTHHLTGTSAAKQAEQANLTSCSTWSQAGMCRRINQDFHGLQ